MKQPKETRSSRSRRSPAEHAVLDMLPSDGAWMQSAELAQQAGSYGMAKGSIYKAITRLVQRGTVRFKSALVGNHKRDFVALKVFQVPDRPIVEFAELDDEIDGAGPSRIADEGVMSLAGEVSEPGLNPGGFEVPETPENTEHHSNRAARLADQAAHKFAESSRLYKEGVELIEQISPSNRETG